MKTSESTINRKPKKSFFMNGGVRVMILISISIIILLLPSSTFREEIDSNIPHTSNKKANMDMRNLSAQEKKDIYTDKGVSIRLDKVVVGRVGSNYKLMVNLFNKSVEFSIDGKDYKTWTATKNCPYKVGSTYYFKSKDSNQRIQIKLKKK